MTLELRLSTVAVTFVGAFGTAVTTVWNVPSPLGNRSRSTFRIVSIPSVPTLSVTVMRPPLVVMV